MNLSAISSLSDLSMPFVGRANELRLLRSGLDAALNGRSVFFSINRRAGIGKTRIASEIACEAVRRGFSIEWARGEGARAPTLWPWLKIIQSLGLNCVSESPIVPSPIRIISSPTGSAATNGGRPADGADLDSAWVQLADQIAASLKNIATSQPLLLILDALEVIDHKSLGAAPLFFTSTV